MDGERGGKKRKAKAKGGVKGCRSVLVLVLVLVLVALEEEEEDGEGFWHAGGAQRAGETGGHGSPTLFSFV